MKREYRTQFVSFVVFATQPDEMATFGEAGVAEKETSSSQ